MHQRPGYTETVNRARGQELASAVIDDTAFPILSKTLARLQAAGRDVAQVLPSGCATPRAGHSGVCGQGPRGETDLGYVGSGNRLRNPQTWFHASDSVVQPWGVRGPVSVSLRTHVGAIGRFRQADSNSDTSSNYEPTSSENGSPRHQVDSGIGLCAVRAALLPAPFATHPRVLLPNPRASAWRRSAKVSTSRLAPLHWNGSPNGSATAA